MKIMSFNILCGGRYSNKWEKRVSRVVEIIKKYNPDTFGLQEAHYNWMKNIIENFPEYDYVGVGREDGKTAGEFSPVFYKKDKYEVIEKDNFWLSETPEKPGLGWDARCIRICSYAILKEKETGKIFAHYNTHLDHIGPVAQIEGAKLIAQRCDKYPELPAIITGDFNVFPDSAPYNAVLSAGYKDSRNIAKVTDNSHTYHAFDKLKENGEFARDIIDFIFVKNEKEVKSFKTVTDLVNGKFPSDHYPVFAEIDF